MNGFDCRQFERWLDDGGALLRDTGSALPRDADLPRAHAAGCVACARRLAAEDALAALFAVPAGAPPATAGFAARVLARVAQTPQAAPAPVAPSLTAAPADALPWWIRVAARPEGAIAFATAGLALLLTPQLHGLARVAPQWGQAALGGMSMVLTPWLSPILERAGANPLVGAGVACAFLPGIALGSYALYRLGMEIARWRLVPAFGSGRRS